MDVIAGCTNSAKYNAHVKDVLNQAAASDLERGEHRIFASNI